MRTYKKQFSGRFVRHLVYHRVEESWYWELNQLCYSARAYVLVLKVTLHGTIGNYDFYCNSVVMLEQCSNHSKQYRSNIETLCCAKNRRDVTSPLCLCVLDALCKVIHLCLEFELMKSAVTLVVRIPRKAFLVMFILSIKDHCYKDHLFWSLLL